MFSTIDSCRKRVEALGDNQVEAIQGCALGLDAGVLMDLGTPSRPKGAYELR